MVNGEKYENLFFTAAQGSKWLQREMKYSIIRINF